MNKTIFVILFGWFISQTCLAQTDTIDLFEKDTLYDDSYAREAVPHKIQMNNDTTLEQIDTTYLFEEDTSYYYYENGLNYIEEWPNRDTTTVIYYFQSFGYHYLFKDSLSDGYYKVYDLPRKDSANVELEKHLVIEGEFKNKKRNGNFLYQDHIDYGKYIKKHDRYIYDHSYVKKIVPFDNGIVNGKVREYSHGILMSAGEYKNGIKDGFYFYQEVGSYPFMRISYYKNGKEIKSVKFDQWE